MKQKSHESFLSLLLLYKLYVHIAISFLSISKALTVDGFSLQKMGLWLVKKAPFRIMLRYAAIKVLFYADLNVERVKRIGHGVEPQHRVKV